MVNLAMDSMPSAITNNCVPIYFYLFELLINVARSLADIWKYRLIIRIAKMGFNGL